MITTSVADLKARLSWFVGLAEKGDPVLVTSHRRPIVRLVKAEEEIGDAVRMIAPVRDISVLNDIKPLKLSKPVDGVSVLLEDRRRR